MAEDRIERIINSPKADWTLPFDREAIREVNRKLGLTGDPVCTQLMDEIKGLTAAQLREGDEPFTVERFRVAAREDMVSDEAIEEVASQLGPLDGQIRWDRKAIRLTNLLFLSKNPEAIRPPTVQPTIPGVFTRDEWMLALAEDGLTPAVVQTLTDAKTFPFKSDRKALRVANVMFQALMGDEIEELEQVFSTQPSTHQS